MCGRRRRSGANFDGGRIEALQIVYRMDPPFGPVFDFGWSVSFLSLAERAVPHAELPEMAGVVAHPGRVDGRVRSQDPPDPAEQGGDRHLQQMVTGCHGARVHVPYSQRVPRQVLLCVA